MRSSWVAHPFGVWFAKGYRFRVAPFGRQLAFDSVLLFRERLRERQISLQGSSKGADGGNERKL